MFNMSVQSPQLQQFHFREERFAETSPAVDRGKISYIIMSVTILKLIYLIFTYHPLYSLFLLGYEWYQSYKFHCGGKGASEARW